VSADRAVLTVSELTARLRGLLEERFPAVWVEGEISNYRVYGSGHAYFTLKDADAQLRASLFRTRFRRIRFQPADGLHVLAFGSIEVYPQRGEYHLVVELLEPKGLGALQLAFEQLKTRLQAEGLFDQARKRELPRFPRKIGIVTSTSGAAIKDMLRVIGRRFGELSIVIAPCKVQGDGAAEDIAQALRDLDTLGGVDVIIVGRGGGSIEDLAAFNEEVVARAIAGSKVPVVSAVGHEVDFTIADFVADLRAPTPSAAAELVVREKQAVVGTLAQLRARLERSAARPLRDLERRVDELTVRLRRGLRGEVNHARHRAALATRALRAADPVARVTSGRHRLEGLEARLIASFTRRCDRARSGLRAAVARLDSLSPLAVLGRGYSLTRVRTGEFVRRASQVKAGDDVQVLLQQGSLDARVTATREQDDRPQV
jgi:exodeoxyribonuclease VII large subunit